MKTLYTQSELKTPGTFSDITNGGTTNPFVKLNGINGVSVRGYVCGFSELSVTISETPDIYKNQHTYNLSAIQSLELITGGTSAGTSGQPSVPASTASLSLTGQLLLLGGGLVLLWLLVRP